MKEWIVNRDNAGRYCMLPNVTTGKEVMTCYVIVGTKGGPAEDEDGHEEYHECVMAVEVGRGYLSHWDCEFVKQGLLNEWIWQKRTLEEVLLDPCQEVRMLGVLFADKWKAR